MDGRNETEGTAPDVDAGWTEEDAPELRITKALGAIARALE